MLIGTACLAAAPSSMAQTAPPLPVRLPPVNLGGSSFMDAMGRPGVLVREHFGFTTARRFAGPNGQPLPGDNSLLVVAALTHIAFALPQEVFGGHWGAEVLLPVVHVHIQTSYVDATASGLGDLTVSPLLFQAPKVPILGRPWFQRFVLSLVLPTGQYQRDAAISVGSNVVSFNPYYAFTFLITERLETSWRISYLWNSANTPPPVAFEASSIQPGQAVHFNGAVSFAILPEVRVGAAGYGLKQITSSVIDGRALDNAEEQVGALGPGASAFFGKFRIVLNGYWEFAVRNRPAGIRLGMSTSYRW